MAAHMSEFRMAGRLLAKSRRFTTVAVLTLALNRSEHGRVLVAKCRASPAGPVRRFGAPGFGVGERPFFGVEDGPVWPANFADGRRESGRSSRLALWKLRPPTHGRS